MRFSIDSLQWPKRGLTRWFSFALAHSLTHGLTVGLTTSVIFLSGCHGNTPAKPATDTDTLASKNGKITSVNRGEWIKDIQPMNNIDYVITPEEDHTKLVAAFKAAKSSIKVGIFGISSRIIGDALKEQIERGIKVTVICDNYCLQEGKRKEIFNELKSAGADMYISSSLFSIAHWKMFVVDDSRAFISTMNFITRANQMRDFGIFTDDPVIVKEIVKVFAQDVENSKDQTGITPQITSANLVWSPVNSEGKLVDLINSAQSTIEIWIENLGNFNVHAALKAAAKRKVDVRVLTSVCGMGMDHGPAYKNYKDLLSSGVNVKGMPYPANPDMPYIHAKSIHVDNKILFIGSENFSYNSLLKARELGIVLKNKKFQKTLSDYFEKDWTKSVTLPDVAPTSCEPLTPTPDSSAPARLKNLKPMTASEEYRTNYIDMLADMF